MNQIKTIRLQVEFHTTVEFRNGSRACSCGHERGETPNLREEDELNRERDPRYVQPGTIGW